MTTYLNRRHAGSDLRPDLTAAIMLTPASICEINGSDETTAGKCFDDHLVSKPLHHTWHCGSVGC